MNFNDLPRDLQVSLLDLFAKHVTATLEKTCKGFDDYPDTMLNIVTNIAHNLIYTIANDGCEMKLAKTFCNFVTHGVEQHLENNKPSRTGTH